MRTYSLPSKSYRGFQVTKEFDDLNPQNFYYYIWEGQPNQSRPIWIGYCYYSKVKEAINIYLNRSNET